jgi:hypothetical protein
MNELRKYQLETVDFQRTTERYIPDHRCEKITYYMHVMLVGSTRFYSGNSFKINTAVHESQYYTPLSKITCWKSENNKLIIKIII